MLTLILALVIGLRCTAVALGDPCTDYVALDEPSRSTGMEATPGGPFRCDSGLRTQWYRFVSPAGGEIPTDCSLLAPSSCSTTGPVWMKGSLPAISDGKVIRQACRRSLSSGDCEANCWDIRVRQCDGPPEPYYVYLLPPTPGCDEAYCAGTNVQCPPGQSSENYGFTPGCSANFPNITTNPKLTNGTEPYEVVLFCDFDRPPWDNLTFEVFWVADNTPIFEDRLPNGESRSILKQVDLKAGMGKTIVCKVRGRYKTGGAPGTMGISNEFYAGVKFCHLGWGGVGVSPARLGVGVSPARLGVGVSLARLGVGVSLARLGVGVSPARLGVGVSPARLGVGVSPARLGLGLVLPGLGLG
ncbi:hypothetical protein Bbelb_388220 [Branchiostoma belcheri]|nr:hypothetical protein Bbelb_388220 [Branchiostoma belcheri]